MRVAEIMQTDLVSCGPDTTITEAARLMRRRNVGACLVTDGQRLAGIITERDMVGLLAEDEDPRHWPVSRAMTRDVTVAPPDSDVLWAADTMRRLRVRHLPVGEGGFVAGVISLRDLFAMAEAVLRLNPDGAETARGMLAAANR